MHRPHSPTQCRATAAGRKDNWHRSKLVYGWREKYQHDLRVSFQRYRSPRRGTARYANKDLIAAVSKNWHLPLRAEWQLSVKTRAAVTTAWYAPRHRSSKIERSLTDTSRCFICSPATFFCQLPGSVSCIACLSPFNCSVSGFSPQKTPILFPPNCEIACLVMANDCGHGRKKLHIFSRKTSAVKLKAETIKSKRETIKGKH